MKKSGMLLSLVLIAAMPFIFISCGTSTPTSANSNNSNPSPAGPTATPTPIPGIFWKNAQIYRYGGGDYANVNLSVNGLASSSVTVYITGPSITAPVTLAYNGVSMIGGSSYSNFTVTSASINYTPGQNLTLNTYASTTTAYETLTAPGNITIAANGSQASWTNPGLTNSVAVVQSSVTVYNSGNVSSPFNIPSSAYNGGGAFYDWVTCANSTTSITNAAAGSSFTVYDVASNAVVVNTPTPTATSTATSTGTLTPIITSTFTLTPTVSSTPTITPTITLTPTNTPPPSVVTFNGSTNCNISGIRYAGNGNLWATDIGNQALQQWTTAGVGPALNITTFNGGSTFHNLNGLGIDPATGNVYVADTGNSTVEVFSSSGGYLASMSGLSSDNPRGVAVNSAGTTVYVSDFGESVIQTFSIGGTPSSPTYTNVAATRLGSGVLSSPYNISFDSSGNLWVADNGNNRVLDFYVSSGATQTIITVGFGPIDVAVDGSGNVFVPNYYNSTTLEYNSSGQLINKWNDGGPAVALSGTYLYDSNFTQVVGFNIQ